MMLLFSPLQAVRPVPALMRFSAPVKKHWLGSFSIVLPRSGLRGFVPVVRDRWEQGPPAAGGRGQGYHGGGGVGCGGPGPESIYTRDLLQALLGVPRELNIYYLALRNQALQPKP